MTTIGQDVRTQQQRIPAQLLDATVLDPPLDENGWLRVEADNQPDVVKTCPWIPRLDLEVLAGDAAVVAESDDGNSWVVCWWPQSGQESSPPGGGTSLPSLDPGESWVGPSFTPTNIATQAELDAEASARSGGDATLAAADASEAGTRAAADTALDGRLDVVEPLTPTSGQKDALAGTNGTPSSSNKYVTNSDPRLVTPAIPEVTALPVGVPHGYEVYFRPGSGGELWHLRYNANGVAGKQWEWVGGTPFQSAGLGSSNTTGAGSSYSTTLAEGASLLKMNAPLGGDYWVTTQALASTADANARNVAAGIGRAGDSTPTVAGFDGTIPGGGWANLNAEGRLNDVVAGTDKLFMFYLYTGAVISYSNRQFSIRPIRVG